MGLASGTDLTTGAWATVVLTLARNGDGPAQKAQPAARLQQAESAADCMALRAS